MDEADLQDGTSIADYFIIIFLKGLPVLAAFTSSLAFVFLHQLKDCCHQLIAL
jgi:hypothetical protein